MSIVSLNEDDIYGPEIDDSSGTFESKQKSKYSIVTKGSKISAKKSLEAKSEEAKAILKGSA